MIAGGDPNPRQHLVLELEPDRIATEYAGHFSLKMLMGRINGPFRTLRPAGLV